MPNRYGSSSGGGSGVGANSATLNGKNKFDKNISFKVLDKGTLSGSVTIDVSEEAYQRVTLGGDITLNLSGFQNNVASEVIVELKDIGSRTVTINGVSWYDPSYTENFTNLADYLLAIGRPTATLRTSGKETFIFESTDGGALILGKIA